MDDFLWNLATIIDILHIVLVAPLIMCAPFISGHYGTAFVFAVLGLQAAFLNCPLTVLTCWLRSFKEPEYYGYSTSIVHWVYTHLGFVANIHWIISIVCFIVAGWCLYLKFLETRHDSASTIKVQYK